MSASAHATRRFTRRRLIAAGAAVAMIAIPIWMTRDAWGFGGEKDSGVHPTAQHAALPRAGQISGAKALAAGPVTELDKELLVKVRLANLWELPAGRYAQQNSSSEAVRRAGQHLIDGHSRLDQIVREISVSLGVPIPDEPNADQKKWLKQLESTEGEEFDRFFANQLRNAHGKVFVVVAQVRASTQNTVIRDLAIEANTAVSDHMEVLEDTGMVERKTLDDVAATVVPKK